MVVLSSGSYTMIHTRIVVPSTVSLVLHKRLIPGKTLHDVTQRFKEVWLASSVTTPTYLMARKTKMMHINWLARVMHSAVTQICHGYNYA